jgi:hypothetical protein
MAKAFWFCVAFAWADAVHAQSFEGVYSVPVKFIGELPPLQQ